MPRHKGSWKRKFRGNKYVSNSVVSEVESICDSNTSLDFESRPSTSSAGTVEDRPSSDKPTSSSKKKLSYIPDFINNVKEENTDVNIIIDLNLISNLVNKFVMCKNCGENNCVILSEDQDSRKGLACKVVISCTACTKAKSSMSSKTTKYRLYEVNTRFAYGMRAIGKGETAGRTLCAVMNLPPPNRRFTQHNKNITSALVRVSDISMREAALEAVKENNGSSDIAAAFDGTWQRRGHSSLNGVITTTAFDTGKVIDIECLSKYCQKCSVNKKKCVGGCLKNYSGSSGGMEGVGVLNIFSRSEQTRGVRYIQYLGDGDSNSYSLICERKPYGDIAIEKLECIGHVQKRLGSRLRRLKNKMKGVKLADGKVLGGQGRLTDLHIDKLQNYYGLAIRRNVGNVDNMEKDVWAIYYHKLSTDSDPQHGLCPEGEGSWCRYNKAKCTGEMYKHQSSLPEAVMKTIEPVFKDLSKKSLLEKCTHGQTQNPNESLNNVIWSRVPKTNFVGLSTLKIGVMDAVITFNDGTMGRARVLKELGIVPGFNAIAGFSKADKDRVIKAQKAVLQLTKEARQQRRAQKRKKEDKEAADDQSYGPGQF